MRDYLGQLRYQLLELGCPVGRLPRLVGEVTDHREDLIQAGVAEGLSADEAHALAERKLGNPLDLAERMATAQRESTWFGRHFLVTFGFMPLVAFPLIWALLLGSGLWLESGVAFGWDDHKLHLAGDSPAFPYWAALAYGTDYLALALAAGLICWLARRWTISFTWMTIACMVGSVYAAVTWTHVARHSYSVGFSNEIHWMRALVPLLVVGALHVNRLRLLRNARHATAG